MRSIFVFTILLFSSLFGQLNSQRLNSIFFYDQKMVDSLRNLYSQKGLKTSIVYFTKGSNDSVNNNDIQLTYLFIKSTSNTLVRFISEKFISNELKIEGVKIFDLNRLKQMMFSKSEDESVVLEPDFLSGLVCDALIFYSSDFKFYFEVDKPFTFIPEPKRNQKRKEFVNMLKEKVSNIQSNFTEEKKYFRKCD